MGLISKPNTIKKCYDKKKYKNEQKRIDLSKTGINNKINPGPGCREILLQKERTNGVSRNNGP
ncbi:hypothetical protein FACS189483_02460 [Spirochaetia bacterium]|nr:hypothetical protein FACS189483_02460 [Spirochaetia bacterium]